MINLFDKNIIRILTLFSVSPGSRLNRKTIKEKTNINNIVLDENIHELKNLKFLNEEKNLFSLNFENKKIKEIINLISEHYTKLKQLPFKEYFIILDIKKNLLKIKDIGDVYLFGSYAKLIFNEKSDIDIAVISDNAEKKEVNKIIMKLEKKFKKSIEVHFFTRDFYKNKRDALVKEILQHGVKLI